MVTYEIECDPTTESCYQYCEDEACTEPSYYAYIEKYAATVYRQCGPDITECDTAYQCLPEEDQCTVTYCDPETEECAEAEEVAEEKTGEAMEEPQDAEEVILEEMTELASSTEAVMEESEY